MGLPNILRSIRLSLVQLLSNHGTPPLPQNPLPSFLAHSPLTPWNTQISEVTPRGKEFLFFSLFSIIGKTSSFIGPLVSSAIITATPSGNNSTPFYFLFGLSLLSFVLLAVFVDLKKSRVEQERFLEDERRVREKLGSGVGSGSGSLES